MKEPVERQGGPSAGRGPAFRRAALVAVVLGAGTVGCTAIKLLGRLQAALPSGPEIDLEIPGYRVGNLLEKRGTMAGAARIDTTPPPGYPNGGDGPAAGVARGYWTRLHARAFFFQDSDGRRLAMVSCDLFALPEGLHAKVAQLLNTDWPRLRSIGMENGLPTRDKPVPISPDQLILAATHTHQGPGNFLTSKVYNEFGSPYSGFDGKLFDFLAERIATAIAAAASDAYEHDREAVTLLTHSSADSFQHAATAECPARRTQLTRNRMPFVFGLNPDRDAVTDAVNPSEACEPRQCADKSGLPVPARAGAKDCEPEYGWDDSAKCPRLRAVDPRLTVLEIRRGAEGKKIGVLVFFAAHPTVLAPDSPVNSSDFSGVAVRALERSYNDGLVAGFFNGADGDIHMRRLRRDFRDVIRLGKAFAGGIQEVLESTPVLSRTDFKVVVSRREVTDFAKPDPLDITQRLDRTLVCSDPSWNESPLSTVPQYGVAGIGGGEGDRTILYDLGWREGVRGQPAKGQGPKKPGLDSRILADVRLTDVLVPPDSFPQNLPVTYAEIADLRIGAFPAELTTAMAYRIRSKLNLDGSCDPARPDDKGCFVLVGLANSYSSYVTTPEEYMAQDYVGASTMWGPREGLALACGLEAAKIAAKDFSPRTRIPTGHLHPGTAPTRPFGVGFCGNPRSAPDEELEKVLLGEDGRPARNLPWFQWKETVAGCHARTIVREISNPDCEDFPAASRRKVWVDQWDEIAGTWRPRILPEGAGPARMERCADVGGPGETDDDGGFNFLTMLMDGNRPPVRKWAALWAAPALESGVPKGKYRLHVRFHKPDGSVDDQCSPQFQDGRMDPEVKSEGVSSRNAVKCAGGVN
jgi:neutral ceramidase